MRWLSTTVLTVLLVGLGTFYYVYEIRQAPEREKAATVKDRLWKELEAKEVEEIVVRKGGAETLRLKKTGETWSLVAPVAASADRGAADGLAMSLATLRVEREIEANPQKPGDFGLAPPAAEVTFKAKGQERTIKLGAKSPSGIWAYAQEGVKPAVVLVPEGLLTDVQKPVSDYRDKTLLAFERKDVKTVEVRGPAGQVVAAAGVKGADEWQLMAPLMASGDREAITGLLEKLRSAKIKEFVTDAPKSLAEYGLDRATRVALGVGEEASRTVRALRFGKALPDKKAVYVQREGDGAVLLVEEDLWKAIPASAAALRDKTVFAYDRGKLERVELESPKGKVALALQDGKWRITAPVTLPADEGAMSQLLFKARDLRARDFVAEDAKRLAAWGLDKPLIQIAVWEKEAKEPKTLLLAPGREKDRAYATTLGQAASVVAVDATALQELARGVTELRDHSLWDAFDTKDVTRITIQRPTATLALDRTGTGEEDWQLAAPKKGKARGGRVSELVWTFRNLKWKDLVAEQGWDAARYGLDAAATTVTLTGKDGKTIAALSVGKPEAGVTYVRVPGQPALYAVDSKTLGDLPGTPEELLL